MEDMKMIKKNLKKTLTGVLTAAMVCSMTMITPFADEPAEGAAAAAASTKLEITKNLIMPVGVESVKGTESFTFTIAPTTPGTTDETHHKGVDLSDGKVNVDIDTTTNTGSMGTGLVSLTGEDSFDFADVTFPEAGTYYYEVTENEGNNDNIKYNTEEDEYTVEVTVGDKDGDEKMEILSIVSKDKEGTKTPIEFTNEWKCTELDITKTVTGNAGNKKTDFDFTIKIPAGGDNVNLAEGATVTAYLERNGVATAQQITVGDVGTVVKMRHGDRLYIKDVPSGLMYKVTEADSNYDCQITYNQADGTEATEAAKATVHDSHVFYAEKDGEAVVNTVDYVNNRDLVADTGVVLAIAPYAIVFILAAGAAVVFVARKRKSVR
jgi:pilin isopeptide linkage protein